MITKDELQNIVTLVQEFFKKLGISLLDGGIVCDIGESSAKNQEGVVLDAIILSISCDDPKLLIGQNGQTILELQRILRIFLNKKLQKPFYITLDVNDYQKNKLDFLKNLAKTTADEVVSSGNEKILPAMSAYERRIIHEELSLRQDVATQSRGEDKERVLVVVPKA